MKDRSYLPEWLRVVPDSWDVPLLKLVTNVESGHTPSRNHPEYWRPDDCVVPWFSLGDIWQLRDGRQKYVAETKERISELGIANSGARVLPMGTVILSRTASVGFSGMMSQPMATTQDFVNFVCGPRLHPDFLLWVLRGMKPDFERLRQGSTHQTIYMPNALQFRTPLPHIDMQRAIADFLDRKTAAIDDLIAKKERLLVLLAEKRAALIHRAVTKGLDPSVPMKDSGVPWIGEIPAHWENPQLGHLLLRITYGFTSPMPTQATGPFMLTANDIRDGLVNYNNARRTDPTAMAALTAKCRPERGDVLLTKDGTLGRVAVADGRECCINQSVALLRPNTQTLMSRFLMYMLRSPAYQEWMVLEAGGTTIKHIYITRVVKMMAVVPPLHEQADIIDAVGASDRSARDTATAIEAQLSLLREYRQALITAAVTGQLDIERTGETPCQ